MNLLIEPFGIEIEKTQKQTTHIGFLLIEPFGIEIFER